MEAWGNAGGLESNVGILARLEIIGLPPQATLMTTIGTTWTINQTICKLYFHLFERSTTFNMQKQGHIFVTFFHLKDPKTDTRYSPVLSMRAPWSVLIYRGAAISIGASKRVSSITSIPPCRVNSQEICYEQILWGIPIYDQWEDVSPWWNILLFLVQNSQRCRICMSPDMLKGC